MVQSYELGVNMIAIEDVYCKKQTDLALLVEIEGDEYWVPKSVVEQESAVTSPEDDEREGTLVVKKWWAEKNGLD